MYQIYFIFGMTLYMFRTIFPSIIRSSRLYTQQYLFNSCMYSLGTPDDGRKDRPKHVQCHSKIKTVHTATKQILLSACYQADSSICLTNACLEWHCTGFWRSFRPSSGVQDCTFSNSHSWSRYCFLLTSKQTAVSVWQMPVAVCTVLNSWWWTERSSETCSVFKFLWPCIVSKLWRVKKPTRCNN
jgi:hypothetical protein